MINIMDFGRGLLETGDLDPIYIMLHKAQADPEFDPLTMRRWLVGYWCLYHSGAASYLADYKADATGRGHPFWEKLEEAAINEGLHWPRGAERRHWRGKNALASQADLRRRFVEPEDMVWWIANGEPRSFEGVSARVRRLTGFGPWIAFKVADMLDRVAGFPVDFTGAELSMFKSPVEGARMYLEDRGRLNNYPTEAARLKIVVSELCEMFGAYKAPPDYKRPLNVQEVETILCKMLSHCHGHYEIGKDIREIRHSLDGWGSLAERLKNCLPPNP